MMAHETRPWVACVGPFPYPHGAAASRRVLGVAESLSLAGFDVVVASGAGDAQADGQRTRQAEGIAYCHLPERVAEHWPRSLRHFRYAWMGGRTLEWLQAQPKRPAAVILYSGYTPYLQRLLPWCRRNGVRLLFDAVEWYEPEHITGYLTSPYQWNIEWAMRHLIPKVDGVIAISEYLAEYYRSRGKPVVIVPPTTSEMHSGQWQPDRQLRLCYAGKSGYNEDLGAVLKAVASLVDKGASIHLTVAGSGLAESSSGIGESTTQGLAWLSTPGMLSHAEVQRLISAVDFTIFVRKHCRVSQAGFPTKFVESFAAGTPVIANLTSDMHRYLREGETGVVCDGPDAQSVEAAIIRAMGLGEAAMREMRGRCTAQAQVAFHPKTYSASLHSLVCGNSAPRAGRNEWDRCVQG